MEETSQGGECTAREEARCEGCADLKALPGEAALEEEDEGVCKGLHVISPAGSTPQVGMRAGVPHRPPACFLMSVTHVRRDQDLIYASTPMELSAVFRLPFAGQGSGPWNPGCIGLTHMGVRYLPQCLGL